MSAHRKTTAFHQAGHAVMCWCERVAIPSIELIPERHIDSIEDLDDSVDRCHFDRGRPPKTRARMEKLVKVRLAGPLAQRRYRPRSRWRADGELDLRAAADLVSLYTGSDRETEAWVQLLEIQTQQELEHENVWMRVEALASSLIEHERLSAPRVRSLLKEPPLSAQRLEQIMKYAMPIPFSNVGRIEVELTEEGPGTRYESRSRGFVWPQTWVDYLQCSNGSVCEGGLDLASIVDAMVGHRETESAISAPCDGDVGDLPCPTTFTGSIRLRYLDSG